MEGLNSDRSRLMARTLIFSLRRGRTPSIICLFLISASSQVAFCLYDTLAFPFSSHCACLLLFYHIALVAVFFLPLSFPCCPLYACFMFRGQVAWIHRFQPRLRYQNQNPLSPCFPKYKHVLFRFVCERV